MKIHLVMGELLDFDETRQWVVKAYVTEEQAKNVVAGLREDMAAAKKLIQKDPSYSFKLQLPRYFIEDVELEGIHE